MRKHFQHALSRIGQFGSSLHTSIKSRLSRIGVLISSAHKHIQHALLLTGVLMVTGDFLIPLVQHLTAWQQNMVYRVLALPIFMFVTIAVWGIDNERTDGKSDDQ